MSTNGTGGRKGSGRTSARRPGILAEAAENIEQGAEVVGEKISDLAGQTTEVAGELLATMKKRFQEAFEAGNRTVEGVTRSTQEYADKHKRHAEMKRLAANRNTLTAKLGLATYRYFKERTSAPELLFHNNEIKGLVDEIERLDDEVVKMGKS